MSAHAPSLHEDLTEYCSGCATDYVISDNRRLVKGLIEDGQC